MLLHDDSWRKIVILANRTLCSSFCRLPVNAWVQR